MLALRKNFLFAVVFMLAMIAGGYSFYDWLTTPDVYKSWDTRKCVKIVSYKGESIPCSMFKTLKGYNNIWVEQGVYTMIGNVLWWMLKVACGVLGAFWLVSVFWTFIQGSGILCIFFQAFEFAYWLSA